jgi:hypothetical protein
MKATIPGTPGGKKDTYGEEKKLKENHRFLRYFRHATNHVAERKKDNNPVF